MGQIINWGGAIERYGHPILERGQMMGDIFPFLAYSFPLENVTESMQWIETESGLILDVHFYFENSEGWILFIESGDEARKVQSLMQQGNELRLLRQNYDNIVQRQLTPEKLSSVLESLLNLHPDLSGRVSIMQVRLNLSEAYDVDVSSKGALELLNLQLKEVFKIAIEEGGLDSSCVWSDCRDSLWPISILSRFCSTGDSHCLINWAKRFKPA